MFLARLDKARLTSASGARPICTEEKQQHKTEQEEEEDQSIHKDKLRVLEAFNEFLFDIFDANLMVEFQMIEEFEIKNLHHFEDDWEEYTMHQHRLHRAFLDLFESILEKFLESEGMTIDKFYELVRWARDNRELAKRRPESNNCGPKSDAEDIIDTIDCYTNFSMWVDMMRERARESRRVYELGKAKTMATNENSSSRSSISNSSGGYGEKDNRRK